MSRKTTRCFFSASRSTMSALNSTVPSFHIDDTFELDRLVNKALRDQARCGNSRRRIRNPEALVTTDRKVPKTPSLIQRRAQFLRKDGRPRIEASHPAARPGNKVAVPAVARWSLLVQEVKDAQ